MSAKQNSGVSDYFIRVHFGRNCNDAYSDEYCCHMSLLMLTQKRCTDVMAVALPVLLVRLLVSVFVFHVDAVRVDLDEVLEAPGYLVVAIVLLRTHSSVEYEHYGTDGDQTVLKDEWE